MKRIWTAIKDFYMWEWSTPIWFVGPIEISFRINRLQDIVLGSCIGVDGFEIHAVLVSLTVWWN